MILQPPASKRFARNPSMWPGNGGPGDRKGPRFATRTQLWPRGRPLGPWVGQDHPPGLEGPETAHAVVGSRIGKNWEKMGKAAA